MKVKYIDIAVFKWHDFLFLSLVGSQLRHPSFLVQLTPWHQNLKVLHVIHKSQLNPLHTTRQTSPYDPFWSHLYLGLPSGLFLSGFPNKTSYIFLSFPAHATCSAYLILVDLTYLTILGDEWKLWSSSMYNILHSPVTSSHLGPNILLRYVFLNILSLCSSFNVRDQVSSPHKTDGRIMVLYISNFTFIESRQEDKRQQALPEFRLLSWWCSTLSCCVILAY
jgi:hypothetical protein